MEHHSRHVYIEGNGKIARVRYIAIDIGYEGDLENAMDTLSECENMSIAHGYQPCGAPFVIGTVIIQKMVREA